MRHVINAVGLFLVVDALFFALWVGSGQRPEGQLYFGTVTAHAIRGIASLSAGNK
jgi:hypothetical protein